MNYLTIRDPRGAKQKDKYGFDWCISLSAAFPPPAWNAELMDYLRYQKEQGATTGYLHWQIYVEYKKMTSLKKVQRDVGGEKPHCETRYALASQAGGYCEKSRTFIGDSFTFGERHADWISNQGKRSDLEIVYKDIMDGEITVNQIVAEAPMLYHQYGRTIERIKRCRDEKPMELIKARYIEVLPEAFLKKNFPKDAYIIYEGKENIWEFYNQEDLIIFINFTFTKNQTEMHKDDMNWTVKILYGTKFIHARNIWYYHCELPVAPRPSASLATIAHSLDNVESSLKKRKE